MLSRLFGLSDSIPFLFFTLAGGGLLFFFTLASLSYLLLFVRCRAKFHPEYQPNWREIRTAMKWAAISVAGNAALTAPIHWAIANGHGRVYYDVADYGWGWLIASITLLMVVTETLIYWIHRGLHAQLGWTLHRTHHQFKVTTPWVGVAFNPLDSFAQALPHHLCVFLFPMHAVVYLLSVSLVTIWAVSIHDRVSICTWKGLNYAGHHTLHHWYDDYNYGQYFTRWDRLMGTYRDPDSVYGEVPAAIHRPPWWWRRSPPTMPTPEASRTQ